MKWPTMEEVAAADVVQTLRWNRELPCPTTPAQARVVLAIVERLAVLRHADPAGYVRASKEVGW